MLYSYITQGSSTGSDRHGALVHTQVGHGERQLYKPLTRSNSHDALEDQSLDLKGMHTYKHRRGDGVIRLRKISTKRQLQETPSAFTVRVGDAWRGEPQGDNTVQTQSGMNRTAGESTAIRRGMAERDRTETVSLRHQHSGLCGSYCASACIV